jgi:hypothetical protein
MTMSPPTELDPRRVAMTCRCGRPCPATTYNRRYCSVRCRRLAQYAKERTVRGARWDDFWRTVGDQPALEGWLAVASKASTG